MRYRPIRRNNEFGRVYARGKSYVNQALVLYVLKTRGKRTRVGLTATKKIGHAVQRNRARRVMKAAIDEHLDYNIGGYDLVFVARGMTRGSRAGSSAASWQSCLPRPACRTRQSSRTHRRPPPCLRPVKSRQQTRRQRHEPSAGSLPQALCLPIRAYQYTLSPWIGRSCRFTPSCSNYTMQAILTHGCIKGILLGAWRIARCNPLGKWGYDPVPEAGKWTNPARRLQPSKLFENRHKAN